MHFLYVCYNFHSVLVGGTHRTILCSMPLHSNAFKNVEEKRKKNKMASNVCVCASDGWMCECIGAGKFAVQFEINSRMVIVDARYQCANEKKL